MMKLNIIILPLTILRYRHVEDIIQIFQYIFFDGISCRNILKARKRKIGGC